MVHAIVLVLFAFIVLTGLPARAGDTLSEAKSPPRVELDIPVFSGGYGTAFYLDTARRFEQLRPNVKVRLHGDPRIADQLRIQIVDGRLPDAALTGDILWPALIRAGKVRDLGAALAGPNWEGDARWSDTFQPGALDSWRTAGGVYGLPFGYSCWTIFYNRALFREHGWTEPATWEEFLSLCSRIEALGLAPLTFPGTRGLYPEAFLRAAFYNLAGPEGWQALNELAPGAYTDPRYLRAAGLLQTIAREHTLRGWEGATHTGAQLAFLQGRAAMTVSGSWFVNEMKGKLPAGFELGAMNFPVYPDGRGDPTAIQTGADCFFVFATGDQAREDATVDFLRFLTSRERSAAAVRALEAPVAVRGVPMADYPPLARDTAELISRARAAYNMPQGMLQPPAVRQTVLDARFRLMTGELTPAEYGARIEQAASSERAAPGAPGTIRHHFLGTALIITTGLAAAFLLWPRCNRGSRRNIATESWLGPLRGGFGAGFVGPAFLLYGTFVLAPGILALAWSIANWDGLGSWSWAGLDNFRWLLFGNDAFWTALGNNLFLMLVPAAVVVPLALLFATLISRGVVGAGVFRSCFLFPNILGGVAATLLWLNAYEPHGGLVNAVLGAIGGFLRIQALAEIDGFPWLSPDHLYWALVPIYLWMACGFNLVLYLAAMEGVPTDLYEAATLDGASPLRQFFVITLPLIWEVVVISAVFLVIGGLNAFEMVWLLTAQDPGSSTHTLGTLMVATMFKEFAVGRATAIAVVLFVLVLLCSAVVRKLLRREVVEL
jgi:raffinose/stachyose/melibiose transport system permease protein